MFKGELRAFQREMCKFMLNSRRVINASETGLGKSIESIAAAEKLRELGKADKCIIICLKSNKRQWRKRLKEFSDSRRVLVDGDKTRRDSLFRKAFKKSRFYVILNYEQLLGKGSHLKDLWKLLDKVENTRAIIILDEATKIKNWKSKTSNRIKTLWAKYMWALTATPVENKPDELFSIVEWLNKDLFGSFWKFDRQFINRNQYGGVNYYQNLPQLRDMVKPILKRQTREEVKDQLPSLVFKTYDCMLGNDEKRLYNAIRQDLLEDLECVSEAHELLNNFGMKDPSGKSLIADLDDHQLAELGKELEEGLETTQFAILSKFMAIRQACLHPILLKGSESVYSKEMYRKHPVKESSKLILAEEVMDTLLKEKGSKIVLFTYFKKMAYLIRDKMKENLLSDDAIVMYTGDENDREREKAQDTFNDMKGPVRMMIATDAGGYGVDLPAGNYIINYDLPWHFGKLDQRNRIQRISSTRKTNMIINLLVEGSVEERMFNLIERKRTLSSILVDGQQEVDMNAFNLNKQTLRHFLIDKGTM